MNKKLINNAATGSPLSQLSAAIWTKVTSSDRYVILLNQASILFPSLQNMEKTRLCWFTKGQLISKCPYEKSVSSKIPTKIFLEFCPEIFCSFLGASWKLFGLPGDLVSNIINKEGYWKPKKLPGSPQKATKNFRAEIQKYFRWYFGWNWFFIWTFWN